VSKKVLQMAMAALVGLSYAPSPRELDSFSVVGGGKKSKVKLVGGPTYNAFEFETDETNPAKIIRASLILGGDAIIELTGTDLVNLEKRKGRTHPAGVYALRLSDIDMRTRAGLRLGELVTFAQDNIYLEIEFAGDSEVTTLEAQAWVSPSQAVRAWVPRIRRENFNASKTGVNTLSFDSDSTVFIKRIHLESSAVTKVEHKVDGLTYFEATAARNNRALKDNSLTPLADVYTFDPLMFGFGVDGMVNMAANEEFKFLVTTSAAGNIDYLLETLELV